MRMNVHQGNEKSSVTAELATSGLKLKGVWCILTCGKLAFHLLEHRVLSGRLSSAGQGLRSRTGEHGGHIGYVLQPHPERAHQLLHKVKRVRGDLSIRYGSALLKSHGVAFGQALLELTQDLRKKHGKEERRK